MQDPFARCEKECCGDEGDYSTCERFHTEDEHTDFEHCVKAAYLLYGCEICAECITIFQEIRDGKTPQRTCHECQYLFDLNAENPYGDVLYDEGVDVYFKCDKCFTLEAGFIDIQLRNENKFRTPIHGRNFQGTTTCVGALYPEGNVQVYWTWKWFDFQRHANDKIHGGSRYCGFQFQNLGHLIGMWDTREIITGLPYDFSHLITTHFAEFYKKHMTTFVLSQKQREALGIDEEEYIRVNKAVWGENWQDSGWN